MGMIKIEISGSFGGLTKKEFSAFKNGHAHCVHNAIMYLNEVMEDAINLDHNLHDKGEKPEDGFSTKI